MELLQACCPQGHYPKCQLTSPRFPPSPCNLFCSLPFAHSLAPREQMPLYLKLSSCLCQLVHRTSVLWAPSSFAGFSHGGSHFSQATQSLGQDTSCALFPLNSVKRCSQRLHAHLPHRVFVCVASSTILHAQRLSPVPNPKHSQLQTAPHVSVNKIRGFCFRYKPCTLLSAYLLVLTSPVIGTRSGNGGEIPGQHGVWMWMKCLAVQPLRQTWH